MSNITSNENVEDCDRGNNVTDEQNAAREAWIKRQEELRLRKEEQISKMKEHYLEVLRSQTTWTDEEAKQKLEENNYNVQACIRIFMGLPAERPNMSCSSNNTSINQGIYSNIRGMMDHAAYRYEKKKEMEAKIQAMRDAYSEKQIASESESESDSIRVADIADID